MSNINTIIFHCLNDSQIHAKYVYMNLCIYKYMYLISSEVKHNFHIYLKYLYFFMSKLPAHVFVQMSMCLSHRKCSSS